MAVASAAALLPQLSRSGPEMDEGLVLTYAERVLHGGVLYRDFPYYGPANLWNIAGAFAVFGTRQSVERAVGLLYIVATIVAIYLLVRRASLVAAVASVVMTVAISMAVGVWAYATRPAFAFLLWSILLATPCDAGSRRDRLRFAVAGFLAGWSILCRKDFVIVVIPAAIVVARWMNGRARRWYAVSLAATLLLYLPYVVLSGPAGIHRNLRDSTASATHRRVPLPSPFVWPTGTLLIGSVVALCVLAATAALLWRRSSHAVPLAAVTVATLGATPLVLARADETHVASIAVVVYGFLPLAEVELVGHLRATSVRARLVRLVTALSVVWGVGVLVAAGLVADTVSLARGSAYPGTVIRSEGRSWIMDDPQDAAHAQKVLSAADRLARPGQSVFVGPTDLRRAFYGPTYMYFLLPQLRPASYYTVINPGVANGRHSTLAHDLLGADWLILVSKWDKIRESGATLLGSNAPNEVVRTKFCLRLRTGAYRLYEARKLAPDFAGCKGAGSTG